MVTTNRPSSPTGHKPKVNLNWELIDNLLIAGCDGRQVAAYIGCHPDTLYRRCVSERKANFSNYAQEKRSVGDSMLLTAQFKEAYNSRNTSMLIWLGKCRLKQQETKNYEHTGEVKFQVVNYGSKEALPYKDDKEIEIEVKKVKKDKKETVKENNNHDT